MKTYNHRAYLYLIVSVFALILILTIPYSCIESFPDELPFVEVSTVSADSKLGTVFLTGRISGLEENELNDLDEYGFLVDTQNGSELFSSSSVLKFPKEGEGAPGLFLDSLSISDGLSLDEPVYYVQAYAIMGQRRVFGEILPFNLTGEITLFLLNASVSNDSAYLRGGIVNLEEGSVFDEHGFVYSSEDNFPELGKPNTKITQLGSLFLNGEFQKESLITELDFNNTYFVRAYAQLENETIYSDSVLEVRIIDGWRTILPRNLEAYEIRESFAVTYNGKVYYGISCEIACAPVNAISIIDLWSFQPAEGAVPDKIGEFETFARLGSVAFVLGNQLYYGLGAVPFNSNDYFYPSDFWIFDLDTEQWVGTNNDFPGDARADAVTFTVGETAYVGSGRDKITGKWYNDFYAYTEQDGWWEVESLPAIIMEGNMASDTIGRAKAVGLTTDSYGFVGTGRYREGSLNDWWRFEPGAGVGDKGAWEPMQPFPGSVREGAAGFALRDTLFIGTGLDDFANRYYSDWFEYQATTGNWRAVTPFPGPGRSEAIGFALDNKGYFGTGMKLRLGNNMAFSDIWEYTAEK